MRRIIGIPGALALAILIGSCSSDSPVQVPDLTGDGAVINAKVLGVCFMDGSDCLSTYVDLGPYEDLTATRKLEMAPAYIFPAVPANRGGKPNPLDPQGLYNAYRLQNNVFGVDARVWEMFLLEGARMSLMATPEPGMTLWGAGSDQNNPRRRDLFVNPITSEEEVLALVEAGELRLIRTNLFTDCPLEKAREGDIVVNLNPRVPLCAH